MVKVNIISGFLGAGKTTLIKKLLTGSVAKEKIILLENEYGEVGVDGSFMKDSGIIVDELNSGCICCTLVGDFQKAVDDLIAKYHPDRLLIEPSGVGKLSEILAAVERAKERHSDLVVTGCATVVDAGKCRMYMKNFGEFVLDQIKTSATVIFSRTQLLSAERIEKSRALVEEQHPGVRIVTTPWDDLSADTLLEVIESGKPMEIHLDDDDDDDEDEHEHHHHDHDDHDHKDGVCPCCGGHHDDDDDDDHDHEHHHHDHDHSHHHHAHVHRNIHDVFAVIDRLENEHVKTLAKKMFMIVAEAESKAHGLPIQEVHFHEVGAIDSIVDIISVAVCVDNLGVDDIVVSELYEGSGHVHCQHGMMPVPVPATANIVAANHLPMKITDAQGEMVTPTGAAIAAALRTQDHLPEDYQLLKIGLGAGKKDFPKANVLRAMLLETKDQPQTGEEEDIWKLESNIDDCSGEVLGYTMERLLAAGARDVCYAPIYMKKNRPAYMLHVLCDRRQIPAMEEIIFNETTTIGIRRYKVERTILKRHEAKAKTAYGEVELKICEKNGIVYRYPEYESVKKLCEAAGVPFKVVYQASCEAEISE